MDKKAPYFSETMTYYELLRAFFAATDGKTEDEIKEIQAEYRKVCKIVTRRELSRDNVLCS